MGAPCWTRLLAGICNPMEREAHAGEGFLLGLMTLWGIQAGADCSLRTAPRGRMAHDAAVPTIAHGELEKLMENYLSCKEPYTEAEEGLLSLSSSRDELG